MAAFSVVIPAHNEEAVIGRCLSALLTGSEPGEVEVVVACNGCIDGTAAAARQAAPGAVVLELSEASKVEALNAADLAARTMPRIYLDADVELQIECARSLAALVSDPGGLCAAPRPEFVLDGRPWPIRHFYRFWAQMPYLNSNMVGSGVYALSAAGRCRFAAFPDLTADDQFVMQTFEQSERRICDCRFRVHTPLTVSGLVNMRTRAYRGNSELARSRAARSRPPGRPLVAFAKLATDRRMLPGAAVFLSVNLAAKIRAARAARRGPGAWERDDSARAAS